MLKRRELLAVATATVLAGCDGQTDDDPTDDPDTEEPGGVEGPTESPEAYRTTRDVEIQEASMVVPGERFLGAIGMGGFGPLAAAVTATWLGGDSMRSGAKQVLRWRASPRWYLAAIGFSPPARPPVADSPRAL